jgi:hypothetical protein
MNKTTADVKRIQALWKSTKTREHRVLQDTSSICVEWRRPGTRRWLPDITFLRVDEAGGDDANDDVPSWTFLGHVDEHSEKCPADGDLPWLIDYAYHWRKSCGYRYFDDAQR